MPASIRSQRFRVIDVETTGINPLSDAIVEIGWAIMQGDGAILSSGSTLVNPLRHIPPEATALHHISDSDVAHAPALNEVITLFPDLASPALTAVAHNASFDAAFLRQGPVALSLANPRFLCTLRMAQNLFPGFHDHKLQSLTVRFGFADTPHFSQAHRAGEDVAVVCRLFSHLVGQYLKAGHPDDLETLTQFSTLQRMPFGKHKGTLLHLLPPDYVGWLLRQDLDEELRQVLTSVDNGTFRPFMVRR